MGGDKMIKSARIRFIIALFSAFLPLGLKRKVLTFALGYVIHPTAKIGLSILCPEKMVLEARSRVGNLNFCKNLSELHVSEDAIIGNLNWITAVPLGARAFKNVVDRKPALILGRHSAITNRHLIDCCSLVKIGAYSTFAGFRSQILTHSIDLYSCEQRSAPVVIGDYCFVGTGVVILAGSSLPNYCVLGASACLVDSYGEEFLLYGGVPAKPIKKLSKDAKYFQRNSGYVI